MVSRMEMILGDIAAFQEKNGTIGGCGQQLVLFRNRLGCISDDKKTRPPMYRHSAFYGCEQDSFATTRHIRQNFAVLLEPCGPLTRSKGFMTPV